MYILGIETSCDETAAAIVKDGAEIISNIVSSSLPLHAKTGGIIPETAARQQLNYIIPVIQQAIKEANIDISQIDALAITIGPGLIGSLLIGIETARTLSFAWNKPVVPVNHLIGHIYSNFLNLPKPEFPAITLIVSGGHTDLLLIKNHGKINWLGGTRDDAAGEAFDKIARLLGLSYPGGPAIENTAKHGNASRFTFPRPMINSNDFDFSFSGLKTAVMREVLRYKDTKILNEKEIADVSASVQQAIVDVLTAKTLKAAKKYKVKSIFLSGGVAANEKLRTQFILNTKYKIPDTRVFAPAKTLCTDNAAMIASVAFFNYKPIHWNKIFANPELHFE